MRLPLTGIKFKDKIGIKSRGREVKDTVCIYAVDWQLQYADLGCGVQRLHENRGADAEQEAAEQRLREEGGLGAVGAEVGGLGDELCPSLLNPLGGGSVSDIFR